MSQTLLLTIILCISAIAITLIITSSKSKKSKNKVVEVIDLKNILPKKFNKYDVVELHIKEDGDLKLIAQNEEYNNFDTD